MRISKNGLIAAVIGAVIVAATLISPALGGPSLKKLVKKEVAKQIAKATGPAGPAGPAGPPGTNGTDGTDGTDGTNGTNGTNGADGTARAYARVVNHVADPCTDGPFADECFVDRSKGVGDVIHPSAGRYCVEVPGISSASVVPAVTVEAQTTAAANPIAMANVPTVVCPSGWFEVNTRRQPATEVRNATNTGTVFVAGSAVQDDNVSFTIVIP